MDESIAWLYQGVADHNAAIALNSLKRPEFRCQVIAKLQQSVEKLIKNVVAALREARILGNKIGYKHAATPFVVIMLHLPRQTSNRAIQWRLRTIFDESTRAGINALDRIVPRKPPADRDPERNTEYPFRGPDRKWTYPAQPDTFGDKEFDQFREVAQRIRKHAPEIIPALRRQPRAS